MAIHPPENRDWWREPIERTELLWIGVCLLWAMVLFAMMPYWHVYGKQNLANEAYRVAPDDPGFFLRSHEGTPYAWPDQSLGQTNDALIVFDKETLDFVGRMTPSPGRLANQVEFTADGRFALVSVSEPAPNGALVVYDAVTLAEVARLAMNKPVGKYNVINKVTRSSGTNH